MEQHAPTWWQDRADRQSFLAALWFSLNLESGALPTIALPLGILNVAAADHTLELGRIAALGAVVALAVPPAAGYLSDRLRGRGRHRMPMVVGGSAVNVVGLVAMVAAGSLGALTLGYLLATFGQNVTTAAYEALVPDIVPPQSWGSASGYMGVFALVGTIVGLGAAGLGGLGEAYAVMIAALVVGTLVTATTVHEGARPLDWQAARPRDRRRRGPGHGVRAFALVFVARLCIMFGLTLLMTFILYYMRDVLGLSQPARGTAGVAAMALVGAAVATLYAGRLSDRTERTTVVFLAGLPMAAAALGFAIFPSLRDILFLGVLYGLGYGTFLSVDWALALDTLPQAGRTGRDLGIWGMASNLPAVLAPLAGAWLISRYRAPALGYHVLFVAAGLSCLVGSVVVLRAGRARPLRALVHFVLRLVVALGLLGYVRMRYRLSVDGRLGRRRDGVLVVANHLHDIDGMVLPPLLYLGGDLGQAPVSAGSRRMFEPGFLADRVGGILARPLRRVGLGGVLAVLGVAPIENLPRRRPLASIVEVAGVPPDRPFAQLLDATALAALEARFGPIAQRPLTDALGRRRADLGQADVSLAHVLEPMRSSIARALRHQFALDLARLGRRMAQGRTVYLTPEGEISVDGHLGRFRVALDRLRSQAQSLVVASLAYDSLAPGRLHLYVRLVPLARGRDLRDALLAERVVTASQVAARCLVQRRPGAGPREVAAAAAAVVAALPSGAHLAPSLRREPRRAVAAVLAAMERRGQLRLDAGGAIDLARPVVHRRMPMAKDLVAFEETLLTETVAALRREAEAPADTGPA